MCLIIGSIEEELKGLKELEVESGFENEADDKLVRRALTSLYHGFS